MRDLISQRIKPLEKSQQEDKEKYNMLRHDYDTLLERMHELENFAMINRMLEGVDRYEKPTKKIAKFFDRQVNEYFNRKAAKA